MGNSDHIFIKKWKRKNRELLMQMNPEVSKKDVNKFLDKIIEKNLKNSKCQIDNNYIGKTLNTTLLDVCDWVEETKPICAGGGVFFKNQHQVANPLAQMIQKFLISRKKFKGQLKDHIPGSYEYMTLDRKQLSEKICANSIYGALGMVISFLFNLYTAQSVTGTGQSLISTTEQAFELFMTGNLVFNNFDECMTYLSNILSEEPKMSDRFLTDISEEKLVSRLMDMFYNTNDNYYDEVSEFVNSLTQQQINRIYYKNNLYEFSKHPEITSILTNIVRYTSDFKDPNKVPKESEKYLNLLWTYYEEFVFYNYSPIDRIQRLKNDKRKCVLTIDTDSNFLNLNPWVEFVFDNIIDTDYRCADRDRESLLFITINTMAFIVTKMVSAVLGKYTKTSNIPKDFRHFINIKNEFLMTRVVLSDAKKRYISSIRLREGAEIYPEKVDIKGFDFMKSTATEETKSKFTKILNKHILQSKEIDIPAIINELIDLEGEIKTSLENGDKTYAIPKSVKELEAYEDGGFSEQGVRAIIAWNYIYPDMSIELPAKIDLIKLTLDDDKNLEKLKSVDENVYNIVKEKIFNNPDKRIANKGLAVIAIPRNVDKIPDWVIPFIDYDTITCDVLKKIYSLLKSLGISTVKTAKKEYFTNILNV